MDSFEWITDAFPGDPLARMCDGFAVVDSTTSPNELQARAMVRLRFEQIYTLREEELGQLRPCALITLPIFSLGSNKQLKMEDLEDNLMSKHMKCRQQKAGNMFEKVALHAWCYR